MEKFGYYLLELEKTSSKIYGEILKDPIKNIHLHWNQATGEKILPAKNVSINGICSNQA